MESLFSREPGARPLTIYERLAPEIAHLEKGYSVRHGTKAKSRIAPWVTTFAIVLLIGLYFMDPFLYSMHRSEAIRTYLYLHNYDGNTATDGLINARIFTTYEISALNRQHGSFENYFRSRTEAQEKAASIVTYMDGLRALHNGSYDQLDPIGKLRYLLFVRSGLLPPTMWNGLNPTVE